MKYYLLCTACFSHKKNETLGFVIWGVFLNILYNFITSTCACLWTPRAEVHMSRSLNLLELMAFSRVALPAAPAIGSTG